MDEFELVTPWAEDKHPAGTILSLTRGYMLSQWAILTVGQWKWVILTVGQWKWAILTVRQWKWAILTVGQ